MGQERHSNIFSTDAHAPVRAEQERIAPRHPSDASGVTFGGDTDCGENNVWRQARRMRDEWRQHRYSRLMA